MEFGLDKSKNLFGGLVVRLKAMLGVVALLVVVSPMRTSLLMLRHNVKRMLKILSVPASVMQH